MNINFLVRVDDPDDSKLVSVEVPTKHFFALVSAAEDGVELKTLAYLLHKLTDLPIQEAWGVAKAASQFSAIPDEHRGLHIIS